MLFRSHEVQQTIAKRGQGFPSADVLDQQVLERLIVENLQLQIGERWDVMGDSNVKSLVLNGGSINFAKAEGFHQLSMGELSGNGSFGLKLDMNNQQVDFLNIEGQATGNHVLSIQNTGAEPETGFDPLQVVHTGGGDAQFKVLGGWP